MMVWPRSYYNASSDSAPKRRPRGLLHQPGAHVWPQHLRLNLQSAARDVCNHLVTGFLDSVRQLEARIVDDLQSPVLQLCDVSLSAKLSRLVVFDHRPENTHPVILLTGNDELGRQRRLVLLRAEPEHLPFCCLGSADGSHYRLRRTRKRVCAR